MQTVAAEHVTMIAGVEGERRRSVSVRRREDASHLGIRIAVTAEVPRMMQPSLPLLPPDRCTKVCGVGRPFPLAARFLVQWVVRVWHRKREVLECADEWLRADPRVMRLVDRDDKKEIAVAVLTNELRRAI